MVVPAGRKVVTSESRLSSFDYDFCYDRIETLKIDNYIAVTPKLVVHTPSPHSGPLPLS